MLDGCLSLGPMLRCNTIQLNVYRIFEAVQPWDQYPAGLIEQASRPNTPEGTKTHNAFDRSRHQGFPIMIQFDALHSLIQTPMSFCKCLLNNWLAIKSPIRGECSVSILVERLAILRRQLSRVGNFSQDLVGGYIATKHLLLAGASARLKGTREH